VRLVLCILVCAAALGAAGCGNGDSGPSPAEIAKARKLLLDGGLDGYKRRIESLRGTPIVVNKWASWCGPCRAEFPVFASKAGELRGKVAFLGIDSADNEDSAAKFLARYPVPYPSFKDPKRKIAEALHADRYFPTTLFYDRTGKIVKVYPGPYKEKQLAADIERYAR
jgi:thiol-disulfide isomerase/thioredoxin